MTPLVGANSLGGLVLVVAVLGLHLLDLGDVLGLSLLGGETLVDILGPRVVLGLALFGRRMVLAAVTVVGWALDMGDRDRYDGYSDSACVYG